MPTHLDPAHLLRFERLSPLYREPSAAVKAKISDRISPDLARIIAQSPLVVLATGGPDYLDCSPRGDVGQVVSVEDEKTLLPDRPGNNRIDSVWNILISPQVALLFLVPGVNEAFRVNGTAQVTTDPALLARFAYKGASWPRSLFVIHVEEAFLHCGRALLRSEVWKAAKHVSGEMLPNFVQLLREQTKLDLPDDALVIEDR